MNIKEQNDIPEEIFRNIMEDILPKRAKLRAMNLLKSKDYTEKQLADKLRLGFFPEEIITDAIEYVKSYKYIDDYRYAEDYLRCYAESRSRARIKQDLQKKCISTDIISKVLEEYEQELPDEKELISQLLNKKHVDPEELNYDEKQKICAFLFRKGFSMDSIRDVIH